MSATNADYIPNKRSEHSSGGPLSRFHWYNLISRSEGKLGPFTELRFYIVVVQYLWLQRPNRLEVKYKWYPKSSYLPPLPNSCCIASAVSLFPPAKRWAVKAARLSATVMTRPVTLSWTRI